MTVLEANGVASVNVEEPRQLISESYADLQRQLHETEPSYGVSGQMWGRYVERLIETEKFKSVLDYGCGKGTLALVLPNYQIAEYDPNIPGKDAQPEPAELVVCTDVLEHIEPELIDNVLAHLRYLTKRKLFFNIATRPAKKVLADGRNAHVLLRDGFWWHKKMSEHFTITMWEDRPGQMIYGEALPDSVLGTLARGKGYKRRSKKERRRVHEQMQPIAKLVREATARYGDALSRVNTVEQWEPWDDTHADMLVCGNVLEVLDPIPGPGGSELERAMVALQNQARCCVCLIIGLDHLRGVDWWRKFLDKYLIISEWKVMGGAIWCIGGPHTKVSGVKTVMGVKDDQLWEQIRANVARIPARVATTDKPHGRTAILACYGPSLKEPGAIEAIRERKAAGDADIVSVSGSHDFLLANGVTPDIHIECDPRPHKALNIERGMPGVQYQIASLVHKDVFDRLDGCDVRLWHVSMQDFMMPLVDELKESPDTVISGGGSVGLRSIPLLYAQGYRAWDVHAMDCSFADEGKAQWAGKHAGKVQDVTTCDVNLPEGKRTFYTSPVLMTYATNFMDLMRKMEGCVFHIYGDGLLRNMIKFYTGV